MAVRIGFVGTGGIANHHMRSIAQIDNATMVAFCDVVPEKATAAAAEHGGEAYQNSEEMYDKAQLDAVYICVPPFAHGPQELAAIERGLPIFVEKPVATTASKAEEILTAIQAKNLLSAVGYHWRYMDTTDRARELLGDQPIGFALGAWAGGMPGVSWWRVMQESGGQIVEQTTHIFDLVRYLLGEVTAVHGFARTGLMQDVENYSVHDARVTKLTLASGAIASITSACMLSAGQQVGLVGLDLYLKNQVLRLNGSNLIIEREDGQETIELGNNATLAEDSAFINAVATGDGSAIRCDYAEAVQSLKVTLAATQSCEEGKVIEL